MREFTRSMASFSWAMSLFGIGQMVNLLSPRRAADAFGAVARSAEGALGPGLRAAYQTGDQLQKAVVDVSFSLASLGAAPTNASTSASTGTSGVLDQVGNLAFGLLQTGVNTVYQLSGSAWQRQQGLSGWGPVQPPQTRSRQ